MKLTKSDVFSLIKQWGDYLLDHQITELEIPLKANETVKVKFTVK